MIELNDEQRAIATRAAIQILSGWIHAADPRFGEFIKQQQIKTAKSFEPIKEHDTELYEGEMAIHDMVGKLLRADLVK